MIDLIVRFIVFTPVYAFFFLGVGVPWALVFLPRKDWRDWPTVIALGLAMGPLLSTTWMFILGTWFTFDLGLVVGGMVVLILIALAVVWRRVQTTPIPDGEKARVFLPPIPRILLGIAALGGGIHIGTVIFWPFIYYDTLWTYGYDPRVYLIFNHIPEWIEYYPKLLHLTYSFGTFVNGAIDDHAARASIPWIIAGGVMMAYLLGARVWGKRSIGLMTAAFWFLTPAMYFWTFSGDLEHTVTFYFTGATVFFLLAWQKTSYRYAFIAGLLFAGALWTKPTSAAWGIGVALLVAWTGARLFFFSANSGFTRENMVAFRTKFTLAAVTGLTCLPIGLMWYIRNWLLDHQPIRFPPTYFNDIAERSGLQFHWLILAMGLAVGYAVYHLQKDAQRNRKIGVLVLGFLLLLAGTLPSVAESPEPYSFLYVVNWIIGQNSGNPLTLVEVILVVSGLGLMFSGLYPFWRRVPESVRATTVQSTLIIAPYVVIWFLLYSYHARLMFAVVPTVAAFSAALIDAWVIPLMSTTRIRRRALVGFASLLMLIGPVALLSFTGRYVLQGVDTNEEKLTVLNPSLMKVLGAVQERVGEEPEELVMYTLFEHRFQFFFPHLSTIYHWEVPTRFDQLEDTPDIMIGGSIAELNWRDWIHDYPNQISEYMAMGDNYTATPLLFQEDQEWPLLLKPFVDTKDFAVHLIGYEYNTEAHALTIDDVQPSFAFDDVEWEGGLALLGLDFRDAETNAWIQPNADGTIQLESGQRVYVQLYWQRTTETPLPADYVVTVQAEAVEDQNLVVELASSVDLPVAHFLYPDLIPDRRLWEVPEGVAGAFNLSITVTDVDREANVLVHQQADTVDYFVLENLIEVP